MLPPTGHLVMYTFNLNIYFSHYRFGSATMCDQQLHFCSFLLLGTITLLVPCALGEVTIALTRPPRSNLCSLSCIRGGRTLANPRYFVEIPNSGRTEELDYPINDGAVTFELTPQLEGLYFCRDGNQQSTTSLELVGMQFALGLYICAMTCAWCACWVNRTLNFHKWAFIHITLSLPREMTNDQFIYDFCLNWMGILKVCEVVVILHRTDFLDDCKNMISLADINLGTLCDVSGWVHWEYVYRNSISGYTKMIQFPWFM